MLTYGYKIFISFEEYFIKPIIKGLGGVWILEQFFLKFILKIVINDDFKYAIPLFLVKCIGEARPLTRNVKDFLSEYNIHPYAKWYTEKQDVEVCYFVCVTDHTSSRPNSVVCSAG